jgi:hypothetical protein
MRLLRAGIDRGGVAGKIRGSIQPELPGPAIRGPRHENAGRIDLFEADDASATYLYAFADRNFQGVAGGDLCQYYQFIVFRRVRVKVFPAGEKEEKNKNVSLRKMWHKVFRNQQWMKYRGLY